MSKVKIPRKSVSLDMTAMCDMAFLLLTFFILTAKFKPDDPVVVDTPASISDVKLPESNIMTISIDREDKIYFGIDGQFDREKMLEFVAGKYKVGFTPEEIKQFSLMSSFGVPVGNMRQLLSTKDKSKIQQPGIPCDSINNELTDWIAYARYANPKLRITIKGDVNSSYSVVGQVIKTLQDQNINKFNLITDLKAVPKTL